MRGLMRIEKNKDKKLRGKRKRKEEALASTVSGGDFQINLQDDRFNSLLDGNDARFGIDRTDPNFKETPGMLAVLKEQNKRRKRGVKDTKDRRIVSSKASMSHSSRKKDVTTLVHRLKRKAGK